MSDICKKCGLPKELCSCDIVAKEQEKIRIFVTRRRYGKRITVITGITKNVDVWDILKQLKTHLACGGTVKDNEIELQGDHKEKAKKVMIKLGFPEEQIEA